MALQAERQRATFKIEDMSPLLYGGQDNLNHFLQLQEYLSKIPELKSDINYFNKSRQDQLLDTSNQFVVVTQHVSISKHENFNAGVLVPQKIMFTGVHQGMVIPAFKVLASEKQVKYWLPKLEDFTAIGCYAQTELAHGSDVQSLQTTATYVPESGEFLIHTPSVQATKYWPGDLGLLAKYALLFAQLMVNGTSHGVHPLWVRIRDDDHRPLPGVELGDIGPKLGYSSKDNGFLAFNNYRVGQDALLSRFIKIKAGKVEFRGNPKVGYASMMIMRKILCETYTRFAGVSLTIAVRYSIQRTQFKNDSGKEISVLDYQLQQEKLLPLVAEMYASYFGALRVKDIVDENFQRVEKHEDFSLMGLTHALLSGCKANYTSFVVNAAEWSRLSCGGHGFAHYSGLPAIYKENSPNVTLEGENTVLYLQLVRFMLKQLKNSMGERKSIPSYFDFVKTPFDQNLLKSDVTTLDQLYLLHQWNVSSLLQHAALKLTASYDGLKTKDVWDRKAGIALLKAGQSYMPLYNIKVFNDQIAANQSKPEIVQVLVQLARLYAIQTLQQNMHGLLLRNLITRDHLISLKLAREDLLAQLRPNALALVEAQQYNDSALKTYIGTHDGDVYNKLYEYASKENSLLFAYPELIAKARENIKKMATYTPKL